jgi:hypothetical protein
VVGGITEIIITWETNETNIYLLVRANCVRCNLVVQAKQSSMHTEAFHKTLIFDAISGDKILTAYGLYEANKKTN